MLIAEDFRARARMALQNQWFPAVLTGFVASLLGASTTLLDEGSSGGSSGSTSEETMESLETMGLGNTVTDILTNPIVQAFLVILGIIIIVALVWAIVIMIIGGPITLGYARYNLNLVDGFNPQFSDLFSRFDCFGQGFCVQFLRRLFIFLWTLLFVIPGVVKTYSYAMAAYIAAENPDMSATEAIDASKELLDGNKWRLFCLDISFIGWAILCVFTLGIGFFFLKPYKEAAYAIFYREIVREKTIVNAEQMSMENNPYFSEF